GLLPFDWQRRAGSNSISHISGDGYIRSQFNSMANGGLADERLGTDLDSGGGVFFDVNGQFELFALMSGGSGSPGYGAWNADMPIQPHLGWIGSTMASLPEPTTGMLFMIASGLLLGRRRRGQSHC
ncbi:MAG: PEP-CTERM sorting domain-containing protein, partial [Bdellovibrionales bacterium]|nr:PEP-CTERM sorting domain-containing protein [Bdellovibrionales bacterium]